MPNIPLIEQQTRTPSTVNSARATGDTFGAQIGAALGQAGQQLGAVAENLEKKRKQDEKLRAEEFISKFHQEELIALQDAKESTTNPNGFTEVYAKGRDDRFARGLAEQGFDRDTARYTSLRFSEVIQKSTLVNALNYEHTASVEQTKQRWEGATTGAMNSVRLDPGALPDYLNQAGTLADNAGIPANLRGQFLDSYRKDLVKAAFEGEIDQAEGIEQAEQLLDEVKDKDGVWAGMDPEQYDQAIDLAEANIRVQEKRVEQQVAKQEREVTKALNAQGIGLIIKARSNELTEVDLLKFEQSVKGNDGAMVILNRVDAAYWAQQNRLSGSSGANLTLEERQRFATMQEVARRDDPEGVLQVMVDQFKKDVFSRNPEAASRADALLFSGSRAASGKKLTEADYLAIYQQNRSDPVGHSLDPNDSESQKIVDAGWVHDEELQSQQGLEDEPFHVQQASRNDSLQEVVARTGLVPTKVISEINRGMNTPDPGMKAQAAMLFTALERTNHTAITKIPSSVQRQARDMGRLMELGYEPVQAVEKLREMEQVETTTKESRKAEFVANIAPTIDFEDVSEGYLGVEAGMTETARTRFKESYQQEYIRWGDQETALRNASDIFKQRHGVSHLVGDGPRWVAESAEQHYGHPGLDTETNAAWIRQQAIEFAVEEFAVDPELAQSIQVVPVPGRAVGGKPVYDLVVRNREGSLQSLYEGSDERYVPQWDRKFLDMAEREEPTPVQDAIGVLANPGAAMSRQVWKNLPKAVDAVTSVPRRIVETVLERGE